MTPSPRLTALLKKRQTPGQDLTADEEAEVLISFEEFFNLELAKAGRLGAVGDGTTLTSDQFNALITIRLWQRGTDSNPSTLHSGLSEPAPTNA